MKFDINEKMFIFMTSSYSNFKFLNFHLSFFSSFSSSHSFYLHRPSVCQNGATCTNSHGSYACICVNGWTGDDCSENIDDCVDAACFNGATCIDGVGNFACRCTPGKTGLLCHLDDACTSNPCHADAICETSPIDGSFTCSCAQGYKGPNCSEDIDECFQGKTF